STLFMLLYTCFFHHTAPTQIYTPSLHDALPISHQRLAADGVPRHLDAGDVDVGGAEHGPHLADHPGPVRIPQEAQVPARGDRQGDRKSTRLNSSHVSISYAVFCLKKKTKHTNHA